MKDRSGQGTAHEGQLYPSIQFTGKRWRQLHRGIRRVKVLDECSLNEEDSKKMSVNFIGFESKIERRTSSNLQGSVTIDI